MLDYENSDIIYEQTDNEDEPSYVYEKDETMTMEDQISNKYNIKSNERSILDFFQHKLMGPVFAVTMLQWYLKIIL